MLDLFKSDQAQLQIEVDRANAPYFPGEIVRATVKLKGEKDIRVKEARVVFGFEERYAYRKRRHKPDHSGTEINTYWGTEKHEIDRKVLMQEGVIEGNTDRNWNMEWTIPTGTQPTFDGKIVKVNWAITATLDRKLAKDINAVVPITVAIRPSGEAMAPTLGGVPTRAGDSQVSIQLPTSECREGEMVEGKIVVSPLSDFDANEVRAELRRVEEVPMHEGNREEVSAAKVKLADATKFQKGVPAEFPFTLRLPATDTPTVQTPHATVNWIVKATLARRLRSDVEGQVQIRVFSAQE